MEDPSSSSSSRSPAQQTLSFDNVVWTPPNTLDSFGSGLDWEPTCCRSTYAIRTSTPVTDGKRFRCGPVSIEPTLRSSSWVPSGRGILQDNSQGYHFFNSSDFCRRSLLSNFCDRLSSLFSCCISRSGGFPGNSYFLPSFSVARAGDSDLIDLSEFFPRQYQSSTESESRFIFKDDNSLEMGSLLRSEPMQLAQMIITKDAAYDCVAQLGKLGVLQFNDLNQSKNIFQRYFVRDTRRCEETERKLRFVRRQILECSPPIEIPDFNYEDIEIPHFSEIHQLDTRLDEFENDFKELNKNEMKSRKHLNELREIRCMLEKVEQFFEVHMEDEAMMEIQSAEAEEGNAFGHSFASGMFGSYGAAEMPVPLTPLLSDSERGENAWFIAGVIPCDKTHTFERVLWRACRRTAFVRFSDHRIVLEDPETGKPLNKCVFIVFFKGEYHLRQLVSKVCDGFNARQYPCSKSSKERQTALFETVARIQDLSIVIDSSKRHRFEILSKLAPELPGWFQKVTTQKAIFHTLNLCTVDTNGFLAAECWIPKSEVANIGKALEQGMNRSGSDVAPVVNVMPSAGTAPPTFHKTNKMTKVYQSIVDSYGIANYREVNPAPFTIITFPFLFGVMFGDAGHGLILLLAGLFLVWKEDYIISRKIHNEIFQTFFGGRYLIVLMGIFSIYTGLIYNDIFAKSVNIFGSRWHNSYNSSDVNGWILSSIETRQVVLQTFDPVETYSTKKGPYPFGVDPIWNIAANKLMFLNSMKMKASVILGIAQMTFGVFLSVFNHCYFKSSISIWTVFFPQLIFLFAVFVYLCAQIVTKWLYFSAQPGIVFGMQYPGSACAPSLLVGLINMFMMKNREPGFVDTNGEPLNGCSLNQWYPHQATVQTCLVLIAVSTVPIMLFGKPFAAWLENRKRGSHQRLNENGNGKDITDSSANEHLLGDVVVHQAIHTIEFVLGCVSHTASYLRLWALSLAHAQLSEVLWEMVLSRGMNLSRDPYLGGFITFIIFFIFGVLSFAILIVMEGLSAFLHALRLHWVEFQSKFYQGNGHSFHPFSIVECLELAEQELEFADELQSPHPS